MSGIEVALATKMVEYGVEEVCTNIRGNFASSKSLDVQYNKLLKNLKILLATKEDKEMVVRRNSQKDATNAYKLWTNMVSETAEEVQKLIDKYEEVKRLRWWHVKRRSRLSEEMEKKCNHVCELLKDECLREFLVDKPPEPVLKELNVPQISGYPTLQRALKEIMDHLKNSKIKVTGVYGTKGMGKTTILQNLNNNEEVAELFDIVIFVKVTTDDQLQEKIANRLMLDIETIKGHSDEVARRIHKELENKKYLLILDEVERAINLEQLGIPSDRNGSKVVIATRLPRVYKLSGVERVINVKELSPEEAWKMFRDTVRASAINPVIDSPDIQPIAELVCKRCSRLPLLIHKIANSFKLKESASSWWAGLQDLKPWPELQNQGLEELYSCLKFCYDELKDKNKQKCFLYTSLYPANSKVYTDYLVECWAAQGWLGDINDTRPYQSARNYGVDILEHLANVSLLEKGERMVHVSMNDCMRQLALYISSRDPECSFYLQDSEESENLSNSRAWQQARWVSMIHKIPHDFPRSQDCNMILTLLLRKNPKLTTIPQTFFENMSSLLLLDLYSTSITQLPSSLSKLTGLRGLFMNGCELLKSLSSEIESLQFLEVLDLRDTKVTFVPLYIGCLTNLRCLRIPFIASDEQNEAQNVDVISKLQRLEELTIQVISYEQWCNDAENVLQQVASLENLTNLRCCFPSAIILESFLSGNESWRSCEQQKSFRFFVGCQDSIQPQILESFEYNITNYLRYCNGMNDDPAISDILPKTDAFELVCHKDIKALSNFLGTVDLKRVRGLLIKTCNKVSTIVSNDTNGSSVNGENRAFLPNLEQLYLENLLSLKWAFKGTLQSGSFSKLQTLSLKNCPLLSVVFSQEAIEHFSELQKLKIEDCSKIEELVILRGNPGKERFALPKLEMLLLVNLPNFKFTCSTNTLSWSSLELLRIHKCPKLKTLPFDAHKAANLKSIEGQQEWWDELEWTNNNQVDQELQLKFVASNEYLP